MGPEILVKNTISKLDKPFPSPYLTKWSKTAQKHCLLCKLNMILQLLKFGCGQNLSLSFLLLYLPPFLLSPLLFLFFPHFLFCWVFTKNPHYKDSLKSFHENTRKRIFWRTLVAILVHGTRYSLEVLGERDMYLVFCIFSPTYLESFSFWYDLKDLFSVQELGIKVI